MNVPITAAPDRTKFIGGSDAPVVLGISPWRTPLQLWEDKRAPRVEVLDQGRARVLDRGKRMEPYVVDLLAAESGMAILRRNERYIDPEHRFLAAEIDAEGLVNDLGGPWSPEEVVNVEIKTVSPFKAREWGEEDTDAIPVHYTAQAQHGLMVTGRALCIFGVLIGGDDFRIYRVERDDEIIAAMREREVAFWRDHVLADVPPAPTSLEDVNRLFAKDAGTAIEATPELLSAYEALKALKAQAKQVEAEIEGAEHAIKAAMRDASRLVSNGRELVTWKAQSARRFDQSAFRQAQPELFEQFVKASESRVLRVK